MADQNPNAEPGESSEETDVAGVAVSGVYKVLGELADPSGTGILGRNTAGTGTPVGVEGAVPNAGGGYGLSTPDDARIEGDVETTSGHALTVGEDPALRLGPTGTDGLGITGGGNVIGGFEGNNASGAVGATIGGGGRNGGGENLVTDNYGTIGGGNDNRAGDAQSGATNAIYATVGGGVHNTASEEYATVAGGGSNTVGGRAGTVGGGLSNTASADGAAVGGGTANKAFDDYSTIAGGNSNRTGTSGTSSNLYSTVGGGQGNTATGEEATIAGGDRNTVTGGQATVGGGSLNEAHGSASTVGGGSENRTGTSGSSLDLYATVPGGHLNTATGIYSFAAGKQAKAKHAGTFVWADSTASDFSSTAADQFLVEADGGVGIGTASPSAQLHVQDSIQQTGAGLGTHVAGVENTDTDDGADVFALKSNATDPTDITNFITFLDASGAVGAVEGTGGGVNYKSGSADVAEHLPLAEPGMVVEGGDVVGLADGELVADPTSAPTALVVSGSPMLTGNAPEHGSESTEETACVSLLGQVPVRVTAPVAAGDLLVATADGSAVPAEVGASEAPVVGRALEEAEAGDTVRTFVSADPGATSDTVTGPTSERRPAGTTGRVLDRDDVPDGDERLQTTLVARRDSARADRIEVQADRIEALERANERKADRIDALAAENEALRERLAAVEVRLDLDGATGPQPADD